MKRDHVHNYVLGINGTHIYLNIFWTKEMLQIDQRQNVYVYIFYLYKTKNNFNEVGFWGFGV